MEAIIGITNKGTEQSPRPFLEVHRVMGRVLRYFRADEAGARECGDWLRAVGYDKIGWVYYSSIDFPTESGAPEISFRELIQGPAGAEAVE
jgi:hypothetical protein